MVSFILNQLILLFGVSAVIFTLRLFLGYEYKEKKTAFIISGALVIILNAVLNIIVRDTETTEMITESLLMISAMALPYLLFKSKKKLTFVLFGLILCSTFDYLVSLINSFGGSENIFSAQKIYTVLYGIMLLAVLLFGRKANLRIPPDFLEQLSPSIYVVIFFADYSAYYDLMLSRDSQYFEEVSNVLRMLSAALIVICFSYIVFRYSTLSYRQKESELQLEAELKHYEEMVQKNNSIRTFRHDYKNNLYSIRSLISSGRTQEAEKYIDGLDAELELSENRYATGNYLADAIISGKAGEAEKAGVKLDFDGMIPEKGIANNDLCTILSNALDNAIRGCEGSAPCSIRMSCEKLPNGILMTVTNPVRERVHIKNNNVKTTKADPSSHGIGIGNIRKAAQKYNGYADISCDDKEFKIEIGLIF